MTGVWVVLRLGIKVQATATVRVLSRLGTQDAVDRGNVGSQTREHLGPRSAAVRDIWSHGQAGENYQEEYRDCTSVLCGRP